MVQDPKTMQEIQERITHLATEGQNLSGEIQQHAATLTSARNRVESIVALIENASKVLEVPPAYDPEGRVHPIPPEDAELALAREVLEEEVRFWLRRAAAASPALRRAHEAFDQKRKEFDEFQDRIRPRLVELEAERKARPGAVSNPPGASPSIGLGVGQPS
jgi:chromosome segregation ATPase